MADVKTEESTSNLATPSNCVDPLDIEQYINPDSFSVPSPSMSPVPSSYKSSSVATPTASQSFGQSQPDQVFSGPSHQYEQYRQQSSLPVGAVANTFALNESAPYSFGQENYDLIASNSYLGSNIADDYLDIGNASEQADLDMDFNTQPQAISSIGESMSPSPRPQPAYQSNNTHHVRAWPGMHQQAAMQAKADAEAQAQRVQQMRQQSVPRSRESTSAHLENEDPHVEESISRLLNRMRNNSVPSGHADDGLPSNSHGNYTGTSRSKKDEDDMDEDERLLVSEEGKKLSSKERRQLRNKVSARAFRSRRKEYIGQLEGELAAKAAEADQLRMKNEQLVAENTRLTDLTRMLLSSPHFSTFLDELSATRGTLPSLSQNSAPQSTRPPPQQHQSTSQKDINPNTRHNSHVGLAMIPESPYEYSREPTNNGWTQNNGYDQQVYAVMSLPDEPIIDTQALGDKSPFEPPPSFDCKLDDVPDIKVMPRSKFLELPTMPKFPTEEQTSVDAVAFDDSNPAFALFADGQCATPSATTILPEVEPAERLFGDIATEKAYERLELIVRETPIESRDDGLRVMIKLERVRSRMDIMGARIDALTGYL